jgi:hypothetical protein
MANCSLSLPPSLYRLRNRRPEEELEVQLQEDGLH